MLITRKDNYTLISSDGNSLKEVQTLLFENIKSFEKVHLVVQISKKTKIEAKEFLLFVNVAEQKQLNGTSFVIVNATVNVNDFPEILNIVPTLQEAEDIIEMEAIERELGF